MHTISSYPVILGYCRPVEPKTLCIMRPLFLLFIQEETRFMNAWESVHFLAASILCVPK